MPDMHERDETQQAEQQSQQADEKDAQDPARDVELLRQQRLAQRKEIMKLVRGSMAAPGVRAGVAFKQAGITLSQAFKDAVIRFDRNADGSFTMSLRQAMKVKLGGATLEFGTQVSGHLEKGITFDEGVKCSAALEKGLRTVAVNALRPTDGTLTVAETDDEEVGEVTGALAT